LLPPAQRNLPENAPDEEEDVKPLVKKKRSDGGDSIGCYSGGGR
jgi:hypothetical protein